MARSRVRLSRAFPFAFRVPQTAVYVQEASTSIGKESPEGTSNASRACPRDGIEIFFSHLYHVNSPPEPLSSLLSSVLIGWPEICWKSAYFRHQPHMNSSQDQLAKKNRMCVCMCCKAKFLVNVHFRFLGESNPGKTKRIATARPPHPLARRTPERPERTTICTRSKRGRRTQTRNVR